MVIEKDVILAYRQLLARDPESSDVISEHCNCQNLRELYAKIASFEEFKKKVWDYGFFRYAASFDPIDVILQFENPCQKAIPGFLVNFMGVGFPHSSLPLVNPPDQEALPIPANWHTDLAELGSALHIVSQCVDTFTMLELGSGIGVWSNVCGRAAKMRGLKVKLLGIEGDKHHVEVAEKILITNSFEKKEYKVIHGIVANRGNMALFQKTESSAIDWGKEPIFDDEGKVFEQAKKSGKYESVPVFSLDTLMGASEQIDLLHVDIQGGEETLFINSECLLNKKVKSILIGTHSRIIEGKLFEFFYKLGWNLVAERASIGEMNNGRQKNIVDGVQYWENKVKLQAKRNQKTF
jgi:FkbM family methyltransferase